MGQYTDSLVARRWNCRLAGWLLSLVGLLSILHVVFTTLNAAAAAGRRDPFADVEDFYVFFLLPLTRGGRLIPFNFLCAMLAAAMVFAVGMSFLKRARGITEELHETEAEVNRRLRVEERMREHRGSHA